MPVFEADVNNVLDVWKATGDAFAKARRSKKPATIVYKNVTRRFG